jgi:transcriptional regulator with XRE-family HTH domain
MNRPTRAAAAPPSGLGSLLGQRRRALGISMRTAARRAGISASYLLDLEHGRNPSTGRAPMPSPPVLAALGDVLEIDVAALLHAAGVPQRRSAHMLLFQVGRGRLSARDGARRAAGGGIDTWIEVPGAARGDAAEIVARLAGLGVAGRIGLIFGAHANVLGSADDPAAVLERERTWETDVAAVYRTVFGGEPAANVCVYRESDIRALSRIDPLRAVLDLAQTHPHVAVQERGGELTVGPAAIERILASARPAAIRPDSWARLSAAAAVGLHRATAPAASPA